MEIFKQLKELGYKHYIDLTIEELDALSINDIEKRIEYSLVIDWFREKHNIWIQIEMQYYDGITYTYTIIQNNGKVIKYEEEFHEYYEAREQAILKVIELCKKQ